MLNSTITTTHPTNSSKALNSHNIDIHKMLDYKMRSILLMSVLVLGFSGNVGMFEKSSNHISSILHVTSVISTPLAFAESNDGKDNTSSDKSSEQDNSNNNNGNESQSRSDHQSENNGLQLNDEHNKTQLRHEQESNKTQLQHEQERNKTQLQHEQKSESENENNNINATHKMTEQDLSNIAGAKANETIAAEINVGIGNVEHKSIDNNVTVQTANVTNDSVAITVNASSGTGPKVILINLNSTTIDVSSINSMHVMYDGRPITPAANIYEIMHSTSSDPPRYAILITQSGAQILISIPHFSTHTITLTNMSQVIPAVPEFPFAVPIMLIGIVSAITFYSIKFRR